MINYEACNFYMLRTHIFPFDFYDEIFSNLDECFNQDSAILDLIKNNIFVEAIAIASPDLFSTIEDYNKCLKSEKNIDKLRTSLMKYIIRSTTRTTPFGLFAGIDIGSFESETSIKIKDLNHHKKRARIDMGWVYGLINKLESDKDVMEGIKVKFNDICYIKGDRIINPVVGCNNVELSNADISISIRFTKQVEHVKTLSQNSILFGDLSKILKINNPNIEGGIIDQFLDNLLRNQYLLSELRLPLSKIDPLEYIIDKISKNDKAHDIYEVLNNLKHLIQDYNTLNLGEGIEKLKKIWNIMSEIYKCKNYLQVDLKLESKNNQLGKNIKCEVESFASLIANLSEKMGLPGHIEKYTNEFVEKYGHYIEVPVLELLDPDIGLGSPATYRNPESHRENGLFREAEIVTEIKDIIYNKIIESNLKNEKEVIISENDFKNMLNKDLERDYNNITSFDMNFYIFGENEKQVDAGNFKLALGPNIGSSSAGDMFGRFKDILPKNKKSKVTDLLHSKEIIENEKIMVQIYETPQNGKFANICINESDLKYNMFLSQNNDGQNSIEIKDIYVGYDETTKRLYLKSRNLNKKIIANLSHMFNPFGSSNIYRFLSEISNGLSSNITDLLFSLEDRRLNYTPRVSYNKVILISANWRISLDILKSKNNLNDFIFKFKSFIIRNKVPKYVYYKDLDNRLLLDLNNKRHLEEIFRLIKGSNKEIKLYELEAATNELLGKDDFGNSYFCEIVVPFLLKDTKNTNKQETIPDILNTRSNIHLNSSRVGIRSSERILFPGEEGWWYYNIYCNSELIDDLIGNDISELCESLVDKNLISYYFLMRYSDPDIHIRLRLKIKDVNNINLIISEIQYRFFELKERNLVKKISIGTYEREIERYGGIDLIRTAEEFFYFDSKYVANLIRLTRYKKLSLAEEDIALISLASMLKSFNLEIKEQEILLSNNFSQKEYRKEFAKERNRFMDILKKVNNNELDMLIDNKIVYNSLKLRNESLELYFKKILETDINNKLANSKSDILFSLMHMFCNRYKGDTLWELKIMTILRHSVYSLNQKNLKLKYEKI